MADESGRKRRKINNDAALQTPPTLPSSHVYEQTEASGEATVYQGDAHNYYAGDVHNYYAGDAGTGEADQHQDVFKKLKDSLGFQRMDARLLNVSSAYPKTCDWLYKHKSYLAWSDRSKAAEHHGFLWIKGKPGCGKSTLLKNTLEHVKKKRDKNRIMLTCFFNARSPQSLEKSSIGLYRSLVHQLLSAQPPLKALQLAFTDTFSNKVTDDSIEDWTEIELQEFLIEAVTTHVMAPTYVFIDALDEGEKDSDVRRLVSFLEDLALHAQNSEASLRICLSSRHYPHISIRRGVSLVVEHESGHDQDIEVYVRNKLVVDDLDDIDSFRQEVCKKSAGIFLWVVLVIPLLKQSADKGGGIREMRTYLVELPETLEGLFGKIMSRNLQDIEKSVSLLLWVLFSTQTLNIKELYVAVHFSSPSRRENWDKATLKMQSNFLLECSRGLVEETKADPPQIQFIHESVREFLKGNHGLRRYQRDLSQDFAGWAHDYLRQACIRYVSFCDPDLSGSASDLESVELNSSFAKYVSGNLLIHAETAQSLRVSQVQFLSELIKPTSEASVHSMLFGRWIRLVNACELRKVRRYDERVSIVYVLAELGLPHLTSELLRLDERLLNVNQKFCRYGFALQAASRHGHVSMVEYLLDKGADPNLKGGEHRHAMVAALWGKHFHIARLLKSHGAILRPGSLSKQLLSRALQHGSIEDVQLLFELDTILKPQDPNLLCRALLCKNITEARDMFHYLIEQGIPDASPGHDSSLVPRVVEFLLRNRSIEERVTQAVGFLLEAGYDVNSKGLHGDNGTALHIASGCGSAAVVSFLLDHGADPNIKAGRFFAALQAPSTSYYVRTKLMSALLEAGAKVNDVGDISGTALQAASWKGHIDVVSLLLKHGADVNLLGGDHGTALQAASAGGYFNVVSLLLMHGADVNISGVHHNALYAASLYGSFHEAYEANSIRIIDLLLEYGADALLEDENGDIALIKAANAGSSKVAGVLLKATVKCCPDVTNLRKILLSAISAATACIAPTPETYNRHQRAYRENENRKTLRLLQEQLELVEAVYRDYRLEGYQE